MRTDVHRPHRGGHSRRRDRAVGRRHRTRRMQDPLTQVTEALSRSPLENIQRTLADLSDLVDQVLVPRPHDHPRDVDDACEPCGSDAHDCHCRCCIGDVDLVVNSRVGERRVVPITIHNPRKRAKQVELQLSDWETRGGRQDVAVDASLDRTSLDLGPCDVQTVTLTVTTSQKSDERPHDVDDCTVYVADLRLEGCGIRPLRLALALLPRDCDTYDVYCDCVCC